jgi:hypothetical protein
MHDWRYWPLIAATAAAILLIARYVWLEAKDWTRSRRQRLRLALPIAVFLALIAFLMLQPDPRKQAIIGQWYGWSGNIPGETTNPSLEFFPDGTLQTNLTDGIPPQGKEGWIDSLNIETGRVTRTWRWQQPPGHTTGTWKIQDDKTIETQLVLPSGEQLVGTFKWLDEDTLELVAFTTDPHSDWYRKNFRAYAKFAKTPDIRRQRIESEGHRKARRT